MDLVGSWSTRSALFGLALLATAWVGCNVVGGNDPSGKGGSHLLETPEEAITRMQREECTKLATQPNTLLETSDLRHYDKGIINDYRQLVGVTVLNTSRYCSVRAAEGDVTWLDAQGRRLGSTPFKLDMSIPAGATQRFSTSAGTLTSGTLEGAGVDARITFTRVDVVELSSSARVAGAAGTGVAWRGRR